MKGRRFYDCDYGRAYYEWGYNELLNRLYLLRYERKELLIHEAETFISQMEHFELECKTESTAFEFSRAMDAGTYILDHLLTCKNVAAFVTHGLRFGCNYEKKLIGNKWIY